MRNRALNASGLEPSRGCVAAVKADGRRLDAIICNAGIMMLPKLEKSHGYLWIRDSGVGEGRVFRRILKNGLQVVARNEVFAANYSPFRFDWI